MVRQPEAQGAGHDPLLIVYIDNLAFQAGNWIIQQIYFMVGLFRSPFRLMRNKPAIVVSASGFTSMKSPFSNFHALP
jgi:hypothetical protein